MQPTIYHVLVLIYVCLSIVPVLTATSPQGWSSNEPGFLGTETDRIVINKAVDPQGLQQSAALDGGTFQEPLITAMDGPKVLGPVTELNIVNKVIAPDGFPRSAVLAGGTYPGPLITAIKGNDFKINVVNLLYDTTMDTNTSVHWHGIFQRKSNWADGVSSVTQCPLQPYRSFLHQFNALNQTGTFWYHSHDLVQLCDGLRGPLVIYDPDDPHKHLYDVDDANTVITLSDWFHLPTADLGFPPFLANSTLINGLGRYHGGPLSPLAVINVEHGKRYRFRIVGASCEPSFNFSIDDHPMTVIETDGVETEPLVVDSISVFAAQRYSVVVTANQTVGNYWIRALSSQPGQTFDGGQSSAILRYAGAPEQEPTTEHAPYVLPYKDSNVHPLISPGAPGIPEPGKADVNINLVPGLTSVGYTINGVSFMKAELPTLLQILHGARGPSQLLPSGSVYVLPKGKVIEISIPATDLSAGGAVGGPHPLHLHGHTFDVIRASGSSTYNFVNPIRRDTISIGSQRDGDNVTFRFTTDNPGPWFLHCHIDFHLGGGFAVIMAEAPAEAAEQESQDIPDYWERLCSD